MTHRYQGEVPIAYCDRIARSSDLSAVPFTRSYVLAAARDEPTPAPESSSADSDPAAPPLQTRLDAAKLLSGSDPLVL